MERNNAFDAWMEQVDTNISDEIAGQSVESMGSDIPWSDWYNDQKDPITACQDALLAKGL